ncbi:unnamed protein product [Symbiodinium sp. KB8]|nr:unnamed protein product [Symbiodinium sp. KB8]
MPRSERSAGVSSPASPGSTSSGSSAAQLLGAPLYYCNMLGPPHPPRRDAADLEAIDEEQLQLSEQSARSLAWHSNIVLRFFCWQFRRCYLEEVQARPSRSISSSFAAWGRTQGELRAGEVLERTVAHLDSRAASTLREDFHWLESCLLRRPARNDRAWIITTGNQFCPKQPVLQQQLWPGVLSHLQQRLPDPLAQEVAETLFNMASALWYQDYLMVLLPWLEPAEQLRFQQWFQQYERNQFLALPGDTEEALPPEPPVDRHALPRGARTSVDCRRKYSYFAAQAKCADAAAFCEECRPRVLTEELRVLRQYFEDLYQSPSNCTTAWRLTSCGLSPLLWLGFTLLLFDQLQTVLPENALTAFADDFHVQWQFWQPRDFHHAIGQIPRILHILRDAGMEIALDKTAILLAIKGWYPVVRPIAVTKARTDTDSQHPTPPRGPDNASLLAHGAFAPEESEVWYKVRPRCMATFMDGQQLAEATAELAQFGGMMKPMGFLSEPSTGPPSSVGDHQPMEADTEKRTMEESNSAAQATQAKFAKGEAKGEKAPEAPAAAGTGKGRPDSTQAKEDKTQRGNGDSRGTRASGSQEWNPKGQYRQWPQRSQWPARRDKSERSREQEDRIKDLLVQVARLTVRLEDQLAISNLDCEFILFFQTKASNNPWSITDSLYQVGVDWKRQKETEPASLSQPLRNVMLYCVLTSMLQMMQRLEDKQQVDVIQRASELKLTEGTTYVYMRWDAASKSHQKDQMYPMEHAEAVTLVKNMLAYTAYPDVVGRFHALRPLTQTLNSEVIPFLLTIQNRSEASQEMYRALRRFCRNAATHLVAMTIRPSKLGRSPLAQQVDKLMQDL